MHPQLTSEVVRRVQADGLALTHARWRLVHLDDAGRPQETTGRGTVVSRLQPNGTWRIVLDNPLTPD
jgi:ketosteroid isomerase-like protein